MNAARIRSVTALVLLGTALVIACFLVGPTRQGSATVRVNGAEMRISGPYTYQNLSIYLIHAGQQDEREFINLDEGLKNGLVKVSEKGDGQVNELQIDNLSDQYLFLQEGDRIQGGKQDRTIFASLVVPPKSGPLPLPVFCIEKGRWQPNRGMPPLLGNSSEGAMRTIHILGFDGLANTTLAPKEVRSAAKVDQDQGAVWSAVSNQKAVANSSELSPNTNTSLNETLESAKVKKLCDGFAAAYRDILKKHPDAVGVAIVLNGSIEEVNIYPNHGLLSKQCPRLVQSYAVEATLQKDNLLRQLSAAEVACFMTQGRETARRGNAINGDNDMLLRVMEDSVPNTVYGFELPSVVHCETTFGGKVVHRQMMSKDFGKGAPSRPGLEGRNDNQNMQRWPIQSPRSIILEVDGLDNPVQPNQPNAPTPAPNPPGGRD